MYIFIDQLSMLISSIIIMPKIKIFGLFKILNMMRAKNVPYSVRTQGVY